MLMMLVVNDDVASIVDEEDRQLHLESGVSLDWRAPV